MEDNNRKKGFSKKLKPHPREKANFLSHLFFCWQVPIFVKGWKKNITEDDLYKPLEACSSKFLGDKLEAAWLEEKHFSKKPSLARTLVKMFGLEFALYGICYLPSDFVALTLQPVYFKKLLDYFKPNQKEMSLKQACTYASIIVVLFLIRLVLLNFTIMQLNILGIKVRVACSSLIYRNALQMKKISFEKITVGYLVNLLSNDVSRFEQSFAFLHYLWIGPIEFVLILYYNDLSFGHIVLVGNLLAVFILGLQIFMINSFKKCKMQAAAETDHRVHLMSDLVSGIQTTKMYAWERPFSELIKTSRRSELHKIKTGNILQSATVSLHCYFSKICVVISVVIAFAVGVPINAQYIFSLVRIYDILKIVLMTFLPLSLIHMAQLRIVVQRVEEFLLHNYQKHRNLPKKVTPDEKYTPPGDHQDNLHGIKLTNATVKWTTSTAAVLTGVYFEASPGELIAITGIAGSGKSTLLCAILQDIDLTEGSLSIGGSISYASQEAWIFSASVKQNILFGEDFDLEKYLKVIKVCALERDLKLFPHGEQTIVGERGVILSGGQKARINLARAIYRDADIYLLDDPLSAVDAQVAKEIFDTCISGYLKDRCVILVTHQIQYLQKVNRIYLLKSGKVIPHDNIKSLTIEETRSEEIASTHILSKTLQNEVKEHRSSGSSDFLACKYYCNSAGHWSLTFFTFSVFAAVMLITISIDYFVAFWTSLKLYTNFRNFLYIYSVLTVLLVLTSHFSAFCLVKYCTRASKNLHHRMLDKVIQSTMTFFNHHSSGRILNRFSKDLSYIDDVLPGVLEWGMLHFFGIIGTGIIVIVINYWLIVPTVLVMVTLFGFACLYQHTNREIKRTEGTTRSSILTHLSASLQGLTTIKSSKAQEILVLEFDDHQDVHTSALYLYTTMFAAYCFWVNFACVIYCVIIISSCFFFETEGMYIGNVGLIITQSSALIELVQFAMKTYSQLSTNLTSVERIQEYVALESEIDDGKLVPPELWPSWGAICYQMVSLKYSPTDPLILKGVSFEVKPGEKIGVVGRTGAGKTSLISVLFRLFNFAGAVTIDGIDTKTVPLNILRSRISIIPQNPVLFLGTIRKNLDPFDEFSDHQLWNALEEVNLKKVVPSLETAVSESGSNFSVGQRQLLCLARTLLRNNKIVVLDEATSSVDLRTDELIQTTVRKKFRDCTVLTIAHRLNTIVDSDKILVMNEGMIVEFGDPCKLVQNPDGFFYKYVKQNGEEVMKKFLKNVIYYN